MCLRTNLLTCLLLLSLAGCQSEQKKTTPAVKASPDRDVVYQASTINALLAGVYDGSMSCGELLEHGDTGLGTFDDLDGEMVVIDGRVYRCRIDGRAYAVQRTTEIPFAMVTFLEGDRKVSLKTGAPSYERLKEGLDTLLPNKNILYAIRIDGDFEHVKARSVPAQKRPFRKLVEVIEQDAKVFEFADVRGSLVGFWLPAWMEGISVPGYHFHFISQDRTRGGHVLDCRLRSAKVQVDFAEQFRMVLPRTEGFERTNLSEKQPADALEKVEKQPGDN